MLAPKPLDQLDRYPFTRVRCPDSCPSSPPPSAPRPCTGIGWRPKSRFPSQAPEWQARRLGPQSARATALPLGNISTLLTTALSLHPSLSHLPLPPAKRTRARSASSPLSFPECLFKIPFFSSCLSAPLRLEAPTSRAARANSPSSSSISVSVSDSPFLPELGRASPRPPPPTDIRSPASGTQSRSP
jgi:hypothetical protein